MSSLELYRVLFLSSICRQLETQRDPSSKLPNRGRCSTLHLFLMQINEYTIHNARAAKRIFFTLLRGSQLDEIVGTSRRSFHSFNYR